MTKIASFIKWHERYPIYETETWVTKLKMSIYAQHGMVTSITFLHHGIHWTLYFNIVYNKISILLNHLRTSSFAPSVNFSTNRLIFVRPLRAVILFIWEQWGISTMLSTTIQAIPTYGKRGWHNGRSSLHPLQCRHIGGLSCWFLFLLRRFSSGAPVFFPPPPPKKKQKKTNIPNSTRTGNSGPEEPLRGMFRATLQLSFPPLSLSPNDQILSTQNKPAHFPRVLAIWPGRLMFIYTSHHFPLIFVSFFVLIFLFPRIRYRCDELFIWC